MDLGTEEGEITGAHPGLGGRQRSAPVQLPRTTQQHFGHWALSGSAAAKTPSMCVCVCVRERECERERERERERESE